MDFTDVDTSKVNSMQQGFSSVYYLEEVIGLKLPNATILGSMFYQHTSIKRVDVSCSSKTTRMESAFQQCSKLEYVSVDKLDSSKVSLFNSMFSNCTVLKNLGAINMPSAKSISSMFTNCKNLENLGGFIDLGKGFTDTTANNYNYALDLTAATLLTHESLMNVINNLYDLNLTYNVASGGTLATQSLKIGSANIEKLTAEEIAVATNKGWTVS
jgi:hypothetical protein